MTTARARHVPVASRLQRTALHREGQRSRPHLHVCTYPHEHGRTVSASQAENASSILVARSKDYCT